jgi:plastocyanin
LGHSRKKIGARTGVWLVVLAQLLACVTSLQAQTYRFHLHQSAGQPLAGAVIELLGASSSPLPSTPAIMDQVNYQFLPQVLTVRAGQAVLFPNSDNVRHHVYSFSAAKKFEIKLYKDTPQAPVIFDQPGLVTLGCNIHDGMLGYIYVAAPNSCLGVTDHQGRAQLECAAASEGLIWHPAQFVPLEKRLAFSTQGRTDINLAVALQSAPEAQPAPGSQEHPHGP